jgi:hypothetical protein
MPRTSILVPAITLALAAPIIAIFGNLAYDVPLEDAVRDPMFTTGGHPLTGAVSHLGVLLWWTAASVSVFVAFLAKRAYRTREAAKYLLWAGLLTAYLAIDDLFMVHEGLVRLHTPIPQPIMLALIAVATAAVLWRFHRLIGTTPWPILAVALTMLAASLLLDTLASIGGYFDVWTMPTIGVFIEDTFKWMGIVAWATYLVLVSIETIESHIASMMPERGPGDDQ